jgi:hypothetical protein
MAKHRRASDEFDSPWKDALQLYFEFFLAFFFPHIHAEIDWSRGYESLDKEFQRIIRRAKVGKALADKLFKVWLRDGSECWLLIHVEIQGSYEKRFPERMFRYNVAAYGVYNQEVVSLAVLCDDNPDWRPNTFAYGRWDCETGIKFLAVKLLDYAKDLEALEKNENPFAALVLAHLQTLATQGNPLNRRQWKLRVVKGLYERNWTEEDVGQLFRLIDWMMDLPEELEEQFHQDISQFEEEKTMPFVTYAERRGMAQGIAQGIKRGEIKGLWQAIALGLDLRFGKAGLKLLPSIRGIDDVKVLRILIRTIKKAKTLDEIRNRLDRRREGS